LCSLRIIYRRESVNLRAKLKKKSFLALTSRKENETKYYKHNFVFVANKDSYDLEAHINSAKQTNTHAQKIQYVIIPQRSVNILLHKIEKQRRTDNK
jgi:hypothetical protein